MEIEDEEHDEEMEAIPGGDSSGRKMGPTAATASTITTNSSARKAGGVRYRECQKNHAVGIGGHAVDGCGEFMAAGEEGTLDALKCAACTCHRNFHRKDTPTSYHHHHPPPPQLVSSYYLPPQPPHPSGYLHLTQAVPQRKLALPAASGDDVSNPSSSGGGSGSSRKRFRSKFTQEQKERMQAFAERLGWRIQKHDAAAVEAFCADAGIKRQVLKVWMHNNKHTLGGNKETLARVPFV